MTMRAYSEDYLSMAQKVLGDMLDFAVNTCDFDIDSLKSFTESLISKASEVIPLKPQLEAREDAHDFNNNEFIF